MRKQNMRVTTLFDSGTHNITQTRLEIFVYIVGWYFFSMAILIYNKWMFGDGLDFKFPIIITSFHQLCLFILSGVVLYFNPKLRPATYDPNTSKSTSLFTLWSIDLPTYIKQILPCSIASAGDIGFSNVLMMYVSLSIYTMVKTSLLMFVLIFGLLFRLEQFNWRLVVIVVVMSCSVIMMVTNPSGLEYLLPSEYSSYFEYANFGNHTFNSIGILLILLASVMSGLRWSFTQILLKKNIHTPNTITTIFYLSPAMSIMLFVIGILVEGWDDFVNSEIWQTKGVFTTIALMTAPGILAFLMTLSEFKLLRVSQVITLSITGIFKELLTIIISSFIFGDKLSWINIIGLVITFADILWYNWFRYNQSKYQKLNDIELRHM